MHGIDECLLIPIIGQRVSVVVTANKPIGNYCGFQLVLT